MRIENRKAKFQYEIIETVEAGIALQGAEVKSLSEGRASLKESFARIREGQAFLHGFYIAPYQAVFEKPDPVRKRTLLLHRREIGRLARKVEEKGLTLIPVSVYFNKRGLAKVQLALARGKTRRDKRQTLKRREVEREIERSVKQRR